MDLTSGTVNALTTGDYDEREPEVSPDGLWIAFVSNRTPGFAAAFGVDDEHHDWMVQWGGPPWRVPRKYHSMSPINHVARVRTPTLFFHGGRDQRCPVGESERMHLALRLEGVESKLAIFPEESHEFDNAASAYPERLRLIMDWFDAHRR